MDGGSTVGRWTTNGIDGTDADHIVSAPTLVSSEVTVFGIDEDDAALQGSTRLVADCAHDLDGLPAQLETYCSANLGVTNSCMEARLFMRLASADVAIGLLLCLVPVQVAHGLGRHMGLHALAGYSLGVLVGNLTARSLLTGLLAAFDTLGARALGRGEHRQVGILALRTWGLALVFVTPLALAWGYAEQVLLWLGQDPQVAVLGEQYLRIYRFSLPFMATYETARRFALVQKIAWPFAGAALLSNFVVFLTLKPTMGFLGFDAAALAFVVASAVQAITGLGFLAMRQPGLATKAFPGFTSLKEAMGDWHEICAFLQLGVPGILSMSEWWFWEVTCFRAGVFGADSLAAHTVAYMLIPIMFQVPRGVALGLQARAGFMLGQGNGAAAKRVAFGGVLSGILLVALGATLSFCLKRPIVAFMASSSQVAEKCDQIWGQVFFFLLLDGLFPLNQGVCNTLALQGRVSGAMVFSLWVVGVPAVLLLAFDLHSLWMVFPFLYVGLNVLLCLAFVFQDWEAAAAEASRPKCAPTAPVPMNSRVETPSKVGVPMEELETLKATGN